jgi:tagatose 6-phosphate kinase
VILAAGLSPAWQQILRFDALHRGEVNRAREVYWCASGKVLNVAVAAAHLGAPASVVSAIGGLTGQAIRDELASLHIQADWIETDAPTRVCTTLLEETGVTTELVENVPSMSERQLSEFLDLFGRRAAASDVIVLTGSLPRSTPGDYYAKMMEQTRPHGRAPEDGPRFLLDVRGTELEQCLPLRPFVVKPNRQELAMTVQEPLDSEESLIGAMRSLNERGAGWVVVTDGPRAVWVTSRTDVWKLTPPEVDVVNPIGCGDSMAAGMATELQHSDDVIEAVRFGMGAAALNAMHLLPARLDRDPCRQLADRVSVAPP